MDPAKPTASRVAAGFIVFAVIMMIMTGVFQALAVHGREMSEL
jgi:hypothetical protein